MALLILFFNLLLLFIILHSGSRSVRESLIQSYLILFGLTALLTELLSLVNLITYQGLLTIWLMLNGIMLCWVVYMFIRKPNRTKIDRFRWREQITWIKRTSWIDKLILLSIVLILVLTLIVATSAPPNTYDSMTYHMSRVAHWIQQQNINYFPTAIERQNYSMPLAEYMILHLQLLSKSDLYANLVQWSGFLIAILVVMEIAHYFKVSQTGQLLAALYVATLPMAILQSTSTQTDLLTGVFCLIFIYYLLRIVKSTTWGLTLLSGLALGLAMYTKGTAYIFCAALGLTVGGLNLINKDQIVRRNLFRSFLVIIVIGLFINSGIYYRNTRLYSHPLSTETGRITNDKISIGVLYGNLIRNGMAQLALPIPDVNDYLTSMVTKHLGDKILDPVSTFPDSTFRIEYLINEDEAGNFLHIILSTAIISAIPLIKTSREHAINKYSGAVIICVVLYSLLFKWQPWGNRLQLPILLFTAPIIGFGLDKIKFHKAVLVFGLIGFVLYGVPYLTLNSTRPLVPIFKKSSPLRTNIIRKFFSDRPDLYEDYKEVIAPIYNNQSILRTDRQKQYFSANKSIYQDYQQVMFTVNGLKDEIIGLHLGQNDWEYPIWALADRHASSGVPVFTHIDVNSRSQNIIPDGMILPKYVISTRMFTDGYINGIEYKVMIDTPSISLLER